MSPMATCCKCFPLRRCDAAVAHESPPFLEKRDRQDSDFYDAEEGSAHHDHLFVQAYRLQRGLSGLSGKVSNLASSREPSFSSAAPAPSAGCGGGGGVGGGGEPTDGWLGGTIAERERGEGLEGSSEPSVSWSRGDGLNFQVRGSCEGGRVSKVGSEGALYECFSADIVRSGCKVSQVLDRLVPVPPASATQGPDEPSWAPGCPLPRVLCVVAQLPDQSGSMFGDHPADDAGCSIVTLHRIKPETLRKLQSHRWPADVRMFADFVREGRTDMPERSGSKASGLMKAVAVVGNLEDVGVPRILLPTVRKYNGKPCLITKSGTVFKDPAGEWLEVDIDIRRFCYLARTCLVQLRDLLPRSSVHCGFTIQGCEEDELPEGIVCDMWLHNVNLTNDPRHIDA